MAPIRGSLVGALILLFLDVVLDGFYHFSLLACPVWFFVSVAKAHLQCPAWRVAIARALVPLVTLVLAVANYNVQESIAMARAADIIRACESYREANGSYPDRLDQLVPRYMNSIPRAKYCCWLGEFQYSPSPRSHILRWYLIPPFGRMVYNFETRKWFFVG